MEIISLIWPCHKNNDSDFINEFVGTDYDSGGADDDTWYLEKTQDYA